MFAGRIGDASPDPALPHHCATLPPPSHMVHRLAAPVALD